MSWEGPVAGALSFGLNAFTAKQQRRSAKAHRKWMTKMSNTAVRRRVKDVEAAGFNKILALGKEASSPQGAMAPVPDYASSARDAVQGARLSLERDKTSAEVQNIKADTSAKKIQAGVSQAQIGKTLAGTLLDMERIRSTKAQADVLLPMATLMKNLDQGVVVPLMNFIARKAQEGKDAIGERTIIEALIETGEVYLDMFEHTSAATTAKEKLAEERHRREVEKFLDQYRVRRRVRKEQRWEGKGRSRPNSRP